MREYDIRALQGLLIYHGNGSIPNNKVLLATVTYKIKVDSSSEESERRLRQERRENALAQ
jgi:hypothetical protein